MNPSGRDAKIAGAAIFVGSVQFAIGMVLAEAYYPNYNVSTNYISDLGATCRSTCTIYQPTSLIFNSSIVLLGILILVTAFYLQRSFRWKPITALVVVTGVGATGVGLFPETAGSWHSLFSYITFLFAALTAVAAYRIQKRPLSLLSVLLGLISLVSIVLYTQGVYLGLGNGGMERMIVYPVLLWSIGLGGHLISQ